MRLHRQRGDAGVTANESMPQGMSPPGKAPQGLTDPGPTPCHHLYDGTPAYSVSQKFFPLIPSPPNGGQGGAEKTFGNEYSPGMAAD